MGDAVSMSAYLKHMQLSLYVPCNIFFLLFVANWHVFQYTDIKFGHSDLKTSMFITFDCGGGVEYLHPIPASCRRRRKGSLKSERVKYGYKPHGTLTRELLCW
jgi:hypothetical protein